MSHTIAIVLLVSISAALLGTYFFPRPLEDTRLDHSTWSNYDEVVTKHLNISYDVHFDRKLIHGDVTHTMQLLKNGVREVVLDTWGLEIRSVLYNGHQSLHWKLEPNNLQAQLGVPLVIRLPQILKAGERFYLTVAFDTTNNSMALDWLAPAETAGKVYPYVYTQCEDIMARTILPCQDTPSVKAPYTSMVRVNKLPLVAMMSANQTKFVDYGSYREYYFEQHIPIPSYLVALVVGNLAYRKVGPRTGVISEPEMIDKAAAELDQLEEFLDDAEEYLTPYVWGVYNIIILPPSFPMGGMENPLLTFASPTIIVGDKSQVSVAAHEIAHSWFGNYVTNGNWDSFWLNEGFTVFTERKITRKQYGQDFYMVDAYEGNNSLFTAMQEFGFNDSFSSLTPDIKGINPDDSFSVVPYEKGFQFLVYLESLIGEDLMQQMLRTYLHEHAYKSVVATQFKEFYINFVNKTSKASTLQQIDWNAWVYQPGPPPVTLNFMTDTIIESETLADTYISLNGTASPANKDIYFSFFVNLKLIFLQEFLNNMNLVNTAILTRVDNDYNLTGTINPEVFSKWALICIPQYYTTANPAINTFLGSNGRMKYIRPIYKAYYAIDPAYAQQLFLSHKIGYDPIAVNQIEGDLNMKNTTTTEEQVFMR